MKWRRAFLRHIRIVNRVERPAPTWTYVDVPVIDGTTTLPDGRQMYSTAQVVRVPVLSRGAVA